MGDVRIFISCVSDEFGSYRDALRKAFTNSRMIARIQEDFKDTGDDLILKLDDYVRRSDAVVHLVGAQTGAVADGVQVARLLKRHPRLRDLAPLSPGLDAAAPLFTFTQWEAFLALLHGRKLFICTPEPGARTDLPARDAAAEAAAQAAHLQRLEAFERYPGVKFTNADNLVAQITTSEDWADFITRANRPRPFRGDLDKLPKSFDGALFGRDEALAQLRRDWDDDTVRIVAFDALGGAGKTALTRRFADTLLAEPNQAGCEAAFAWSFYSQGSDEDRQTDASDFFKAAFRFFDDIEPPTDARK